MTFLLRIRESLTRLPDGACRKIGFRKGDSLGEVHAKSAARHRPLSTVRRHRRSGGDGRLCKFASYKSDTPGGGQGQRRGRAGRAQGKSRCGGEGRRGERNEL